MDLSARLTDSADDVQPVLDAVRRIFRALRESSRAAERSLGVTGAQLFVLQQLDGDRALSLNELAARTRTHQSTVSVVVSRLVERGLVARAPSESDGRRVELALTRAGKALRKKAPAAAQEALIDGIERLPPPKRHALAAALTLLVEKMELPDDAPQMFFEDAVPAGGERKGPRHSKRAPKAEPKRRPKPAPKKEAR